jgi:hypothetical protein
VVKTILLDMPTSFVLAHLFIWFGRKEVQAKSETWTWPLKATWFFTLFVFVPITGYAFYRYPGWSTVYLRPENLIPNYAGPLILFLYFTGAVLGSFIAQSFLQLKRVREFWISLGFGVIWWVFCMILTWTEYQHVGTYEEFHGGLAKPIQEVPEFMNQLNLMGILIAVPALALVFLLRKRSARF